MYTNKKTSGILGRHLKDAWRPGKKSTKRQNAKDREKNTGKLGWNQAQNFKDLSYYVKTKQQYIRDRLFFETSIN